MKLGSYFTFIKRVFSKKGLPLQLIFYVTARCNLKCIHCFYWKNLNASSRELILEEIEKIAEGLPNLLWLSLTGGEPFLRQDLPEIAKVFYRNSNVRHITIPTNGIQTEKIVRVVSEIASHCKESHLSVYVSLDGLYEVHDRIRGRKDSFQAAVRTLKELKHLQADVKNLDVSTVTTVLSTNQRELKALYAFIKGEIKPNNIVINLIRGSLSNADIKQVDINLYDQICRDKMSTILTKGLPYYRFSLSGLVMAKDAVMYQMVSETVKRKKYIYPCYAGNISAVINEEGVVYPCEMFRSEIGSIRDYNYDFAALWTSKKAESIREYIKKERCFCTWECAMGTNILFNPRLYPRLAKEYLSNLFSRSFVYSR